MPAEPEPAPQEAAAEDEPRYLRRQKPVEIRRRRFGRRSWQQIRRGFVLGFWTLAAGAVLFFAGRFFLFSPRVLLRSPDQIEVRGNHFVPRTSVVERFYADRDKSVLRVPLDERRRSLEEIAWVEHAAVERLLPNRIRVELVERTPVAFVRTAGELALMDAHGVLLERPAEGEFHFPVVDGVAAITDPAARERRMKLFTDFVKEIELVRPGAADRVSEVNLADEKDLRATLAGLPEFSSVESANTAVLVHFGDTDFGPKFKQFVENFAQWRAATGRVVSVDLRFARQVVVNPERDATASAQPAR